MLLFELPLAVGALPVLLRVLLLLHHILPEQASICPQISCLQASNEPRILCFIVCGAKFQRSATHVKLQERADTDAGGVQDVGE